MGRPVPDLSSALSDRERTFAEIGSIAREKFGSRATIQAITVQRFERRLLRYSVELASERSPWIVIGKVYDGRADGQRGFDAMRALWDGGFSERPPSSVRIPTPYSYLSDLRLLLMEDAPGTMLKALVKRKCAGPGEMQLFGAALAKLHRSPATFGEPFGVEDHLAIRCAGLHEALSEAFPLVRERVLWIVERASELESGGMFTPTLVHGDFHLGQVHVQDREMWILDLDPLHVGDPAYDIAMVFVMLNKLEHRTRDSAYVRSLRDSFLAAYFAEQDCRLAVRVPLHMSLIHLKRACKRFRWQDEPQWPSTICRLIDEGVACLETVRLSAMPQSVSEVAEIYDHCPASL